MDFQDCDPNDFCTKITCPYFTEKTITYRRLFLKRTYTESRCRHFKGSGCCPLQKLKEPPRWCPWPYGVKKEFHFPNGRKAVTHFNLREGQLTIEELIGPSPQEKTAGRKLDL